MLPKLNTSLGMLHCEYTEDIQSSVITSDSTFSNIFPELFAGMGDTELLLHIQQALAQHCLDYIELTELNTYLEGGGSFPNNKNLNKQINLESYLTAPEAGSTFYSSTVQMFCVVYRCR